MTRAIAYLVTALLLVFGLYLLFNIKYAYRVLPITQPLSVNPYDLWRDFTSEKAHFTARLPLLPQQGSQTVNDPRTNTQRHYEMFISEKNDGTTFVITEITFPDERERVPKELLESLRQESLTSRPGSKLLSEDTQPFLGHDALSFTTQDGDSITRSKAFIVDKRLYLLMVISNKEVPVESDFNFFVNSFKILPVAK